MTVKAEGRLPEVTALRLVRVSSRTGRAPSPPLGLRSWSLAEDASLAILLDAEDGTSQAPPGRGLRQAGTSSSVPFWAAQIPLAEELPGGCLVMVLGEADAPRGVLARVTRKRPRVPRSVRATALLARGYARIGAALDPKTGQDLAWGYAIRSC